MSTPIATAVGAIVAALEQVPAVSATVQRARLRPLAADVGDAIVVRPVDAQRDESTLGYGGPDVWAVRIGVECYARAYGADPDTAVDALAQAAYARLMADPTLGDAIRGGITPLSIAYDFDAADDRYACATFTLSARITSGPSFTSP